MSDTVTLLPMAPARSTGHHAGRSAAPRPAGGKRKAGGRRAGRLVGAVAVVARALLTAAAVLLLWSVAPAALPGWHSTVVMTGSMSPRLAVGDVAIARPVATADLHIGQVLLVDDPDHPGRLRLHRLVDVRDGKLVLKGDANATADSSPVDPSSVRGLGVLRVPAIGLPVARWAAGDPVPAALAAGAFVVLVLLVGLGGPATATRPSAVPPFPYAVPPPRSAVREQGRPGHRRRLVALVVLLCGGAGLAYAVVPSWAAYSGATTSRLSVATNAYYTCQNAAYDGSPAAPGPDRALRYFPLQESDTTGTAADSGSQNVGPGTYVNAPTPSALGQANCGAGGTRCVTFDGTSQMVTTTTPVTALGNTTVAMGFESTSTTGGMLFGLADNAAGQMSAVADRVIYMTATGQVGFGVLNGTTPTGILSPGSYNNGAWHVVDGVLSSSGMTLYIDGYPVVSSSTTTSANAVTGKGYPRIGFDSLAGYPSAPANQYFAGSLAHAGIMGVALDQTRIIAQVYAAF